MKPVPLPSTVREVLPHLRPGQYVLGHEDLKNTRTTQLLSRLFAAASWETASNTDSRLLRRTSCFSKGASGANGRWPGPNRSSRCSLRRGRCQAAAITLIHQPKHKPGAKRGLGNHLLLTRTYTSLQSHKPRGEQLKLSKQAREG